MKRTHFIYSLFALVLCFSLIACSGDDEGDLGQGPDPSGLALGNIVGKFGDIEFSGTGFGTIGDFGIGADRIFSIAGSNLFNSNGAGTIALIMTYPEGRDIGTGTYSNTNGDCELATEVCPSLVFSYFDDNDLELTVGTAETGSDFQIEVTSVNFSVGGTMQGNFSGTGVDIDGNTVEIKEGAFNVSIN